MGLTWYLEATGTKPYRGARFDVQGDVFDALEDIVENAGIEMLWRADVVDSKLVATLVVADKFEHVGTLEIKDGPDGNIMARPRIIRDPSNVVHKILHRRAVRPRGDDAGLRPLGYPEQHAEGHGQCRSGPLRRRAKLDVSVPWGFSTSTLASLVSADARRSVGDVLRLPARHP